MDIARSNGSDGRDFDVSNARGKATAVRHELSLTGEDMDAVGSSENDSAEVMAPHWGNHEDISDLECMLGIGILMFWKNKHAGPGRLFISYMSA